MRLRKKEEFVPRKANHRPRCPYRASLPVMGLAKQVVANVGDVGALMPEITSTGAVAVKIIPADTFRAPEIEQPSEFAEICTL